MWGKKVSDILTWIILIKASGFCLVAHIHCPFRSLSQFLKRSSE